MFFFFHDTATTDIYTLSLHDALPICHHEIVHRARREHRAREEAEREHASGRDTQPDRKSTRLNSSHGYISYAVFCLKKKTTRNFLDCHNKHCHIGFVSAVGRTWLTEH